VSEGGHTRWTPRARRLAAIAFVIAMLVGGSAALFGGVCDSLSLDCLRNQGKNAVRIAVIAIPFVAYAVYRFTRTPHRDEHDPGEDA